MFLFKTKKLTFGATREDCKIAMFQQFGQILRILALH